MLVYHFVNKKYACSNIDNKQLKIATIDDLNDPYEFYVNFANSGELLNEQTSESIKSHYSGIMGLLCFSERWNNPVLWAHYGDKHKGICMEFDIPDKFLLKVEYKQELAIVEGNDRDWRNKFAQATKTKYEHWSYEEEYRICFKLGSTEVLCRDGLFFIPFSSKLALQRVFLGLRCELSETERQKLEQRQIPIIHTCLSKSSYSVIEVANIR